MQTRKYVRGEINNLDPNRWVCNIIKQGYTYTGVGNRFHPAITEAPRHNGCHKCFYVVPLEARIKLKTKFYFLHKKCPLSSFLYAKQNSD
jgi:hypothetical protein